MAAAEDTWAVLTASYISQSLMLRMGISECRATTNSLNPVSYQRAFKGFGQGIIIIIINTQDSDRGCTF